MASETYPVTLEKAIPVTVVVTPFGSITPASFSHLSKFFPVMVSPVAAVLPNLEKASHL